MATATALASLIDPSLKASNSAPSIASDALVTSHGRSFKLVEVVPPPPTCGERFCGELKRIGADVLGALCDIVYYIGINILLGLAAGFTFPTITVPIVVCLGAALATAFVVKFLDRHDFKCLSGIKLATYEFRNKHRRLTIIAFVVSFILFLVAPLTPVIMYVSASLLGILQGFIAQVGMAEKKIEVALRSKAASTGNPISPSNN